MSNPLQTNFVQSAKRSLAPAMVALLCHFTPDAAADPQEESTTTFLHPSPLTATIRATGSHSNVLFTFKRTARKEEDRVVVNREYRDPDGKLAAREKVVYRQGNLLSYSLEEPQISGEGSVRILRSTHPGRVEYEYRKGTGSDVEQETATAALKDELYVNDMLGLYIRDHWERLAKGETVRFHYLVVPRCETVAFDMKKIRNTEWKGREAVVLKMSLSNWLLSAFVDPIYFTVEKAAPHRVFMYEGRTLPKIREEGSWKDFRSVTVFEWEPTEPGR